MAAWKGGGRGKGVLLRGGSDNWGEWWWSGRKSRRVGLVGCGASGWTEEVGLSDKSSALAGPIRSL